jgi:tRNA threonylcarbamoyladenosine biosynthesis protein TsaB
MTPLVLALDASHMKGSAAVTQGREILCEIVFDASDTHSATLMPAVDECLKTAGVRTSDIDLFVTVIGPGSFTGLRIGLATVKGFAAVNGRPVAAVGSLELLAAAIPFVSDPVLPLIDARRGEVYAAVYDMSSGGPIELLPPFASSPDSLGDITADSIGGRGIIICGTGSERYRSELEEALPQGTRYCGPKWSVPSASIAAALALEREPVPYENLSDIEPLYIRPPDAKPPSSAKLRPGGGR